MRSTPKLVTAAFVLIAAFAVTSTAASAAAELDPGVFARVGQNVITAEEFTAALRDGMRRSFYHGKVPEAELAAFQREVGDKLIDRVLLREEAARRGIGPDAAWVEERLGNFERRFSQHAQWDENRVRILGSVRSQLETLSRIDALEAQVRAAVPSPSPEVLRAYYEANAEKFTEPERFRVSTILLKVDPSSPNAMWEAALQEARGLVDRLRGGADFAELARLHSGDGSAQKGGDMGYLHRGMLGAPAQKAVDEAQPGKVTDPVRLLEGVAIFRVDDRPPRRLRPFEGVRERAEDLWLRERREQAWNDLRRQLRERTDVQVNTSHYLPLPG